MEIFLFITHETAVGLILIKICAVAITYPHALNPWMCLSFTPVHPLTPPYSSLVAPHLVPSYAVISLMSVAW